MSSKPISSLSDVPLLPSAIDRESGKKSSLAPVIHESLSGLRSEKNCAFIQRTITERNDRDDCDSLAPSNMSETTDGYSVNVHLPPSSVGDRLRYSTCESEAEPEYDDDVDCEASPRDYLTKRSRELADEYISKTDFRLVKIRR